MTLNTWHLTYPRLALMLLTAAVLLLAGSYVSLSAENRKLRQNEEAAQQLASSMVLTAERQAKQNTDLKTENDRLRAMLFQHRRYAPSSPIRLTITDCCPLTTDTTEEQQSVKEVMSHHGL